MAQATGAAVDPSNMSHLPSPLLLGGGGGSPLCQRSISTFIPSSDASSPETSHLVL